MVAKLQSGHWWSNVPFTMMQPAHWLTNRTASGFLHRIPHSTQVSAPRPRETQTEAELVVASKVVRFKQGLLAMGKKFEPSAEFVFKLGDANECWFIGLCFKSYAWVVQAEEVVRGGDGPCGVRFTLPLVIRPLFELFAERDSSGQVVGRADASDEWTIGGGIYSNSSGIFKIRAVPAQ